ncbi:hypothetical protein B0T24DRAFT_526343 [Lasiosphaeria ovina]|uniref:2EXR domain-containing protein n=1 Tax=Lasiosphaeria ovina TaxID=92902 RepID=A0AAE0N9E8_9PEZI|nr:hypothetical protein B0T24DRAFT_526343 [Lasiosphaeria ovina]
MAWLRFGTPKVLASWIHSPTKKEAKARKKKHQQQQLVLEQVLEPPADPAQRGPARRAKTVRPAPAPSNSAVFEQFSRLPAEVRQEVWKLAAAAPSANPGVCIFTVDPLRHVAPLVVHERHNADLLATNTEAHDIALQTRGGSRAFDPDADILYISKANFPYFAGTFCARQGAAPIAARIRHIAVGLAETWFEGTWHRPLMSVAGALEQLPALETLSVVFPRPAPGAPVGSVDDPELPAAGTPLRRLTGEELYRVKIAVSGSSSSAAAAEWQRSAAQHLAKVKAELDVEYNPGHLGGDTPPLWDWDSKSLRLRYQARVFEPVDRETFHKSG